MKQEGQVVRSADIRLALTPVNIGQAPVINKGEEQDTESGSSEEEEN